MDDPRRKKPRAERHCSAPVGQSPNSAGLTASRGTGVLVIRLLVCGTELLAGKCYHFKSRSLSNEIRERDFNTAEDSETEMKGRED